MNNKFLIGFLLLAIGTAAQDRNGSFLFDNDWRFYRGGLQGAAASCSEIMAPMIMPTSA